MNINERNQKIKEAAEYINSKINNKPKIGMILGSGLGGLVEEFEDSVSIKFEEIPHCPTSSVEGHKGEIVSGKINGVDVIALAGRIHFYEGYPMEKVCFPLRVMGEIGIKCLIVTNAGGGVNENYSPGDIVIIRDHINMMGTNPLIGGPEFIDMTNAYDYNLRKEARKTGEKLGINLNQGVYLAVSGPSYETPAEIVMVRKIGADIVGMSTVPETIVANSLGIKVLGLSMVTNMAAGITGEPLSHEEVIETTTIAQKKFKELVRNIVNNIKA